MAAKLAILFVVSFLFCIILVNSKAVSKKKPTHKPDKEDTSHNQHGAGHHQVNSLPKVEGKHEQEGDENEDSDNEVDHGHPNEIPPNHPVRKGFQGGVVLLGKHPSCADDIQRLCHEIPPEKNFEILVCLQDKAREDDISKECHNLLWSYKKNLTCDSRFEDAAKRFCKDDLKKLPYCTSQLAKYPGKGKLIPCMLMHRQVNITSPECHSMLTKMQAIVFSNYHLIEGFFDKCHDDVTKLGCGRITNNDQDEEDIHDQNSVLECLEDQTENLGPECQKEIYRMAELSSDDYHLDRPLYYACRDDREKFCAEIPAGEGKVYTCLKEHKFDEKMSKECQAALTIRQKVESNDYKANYGLLKSCEADFKLYKEEYNCPEGKTAHGSLSNVLICMETALNDGKPIDSKCQSELLEIRQQLMEDYKINPEVVSSCEVEIKDHCSQGKEREGKTLDCLMKLAEEGHPDQINKKCIRALSMLVKETGAGGDYRIDHTLHRACEPVVQTMCKDKGTKDGDVMILTCLMDHLNDEDMIPECRQQLLHLQFFIARDFRLDPELYRSCKKDAADVCHAPKFNEENDEMPSGMIVSCLYRNSFPGGKVSTGCAHHVRRVMHQRALDVHLIPEIQEACMDDLGQFCSHSIEKGQEIECLQTHLEKLKPQCREVMRNFTEMEGQDYQLDQTLVKMCTGMVTKFCADVINTGDSEGVLPCLIEHKNDPEMNEKCQASIHHWQLIELKDFTFSSKFKKACRKDVAKHCPQAQNKHAVVKCLSEKVRNAIISEQGHVISQECRNELHVAEKEEGEDIRFDPEMYGECAGDAKKHCSHVEEGQAKVLECLKENFEVLSKKCKKLVFEREKNEMQDPGIDYKLIKTCQKAIERFCSEEDPRDILKCLKEHKHDPGMDRKCSAVITKRQKAQYENDELDPELHGSCKRDMKKFCKNYSGKDMGQMVSCLKKHVDKLTEDCEHYIRSVTREESLDYRLDPTLSKYCSDEIKHLCEDHIESGKGRVEECLRKNFGKITPASRCYGEVIRTMKEGRTDIFVDPQLYDACHLDVIKHCSDVLPGKGRVTNCLIHLKKDKRHGLSRDCNLELTLRMNQWGSAKLVPLESLSDLAFSINTSPSKSYFFMVFAVALAIIFIGGLMFGRFSKRIKREIKDR